MPIAHRLIFDLFLKKARIKLVGMVSPNKTTDIPAEAIPLFHKIRHDHVSPHYIAYYLEYLTFHMPVAKLVPALKWLVKNDLRGQRFVDFVNGQCKRSGLELIRHLTMRLECEKRERKLYAVDIRS